jgi:hypothetical protein
MLQTNIDPGSLPTISSVSAAVIAAFTPAFIAGFCVQRFLEILDSLFSLDAYLNKDRKQALLNVGSLIVGLALASTLDIKMFSAIKVAASPLLDWIVTGFVISAGTDGINSILKFMSYAKQDRNLDVQNKQIENATSTENLRLLQVSGLRAIAAGQPAFPTFVLDDDLEFRLHEHIKAFAGNKFNEATWKDGPFSSYTTLADDAKILVLAATKDVVDAYNRVFLPGVPQNLQTAVSLATTPTAILPTMANAVRSGSQPRTN